MKLTKIYSDADNQIQQLSSVILRPGSSASPRNLLEMQILRLQMNQKQFVF